MTKPNPLNLENAKDIVSTFNTGYVTEDMVLLTVTASRAANFIEAWIAVETERLLKAVREPAL